MPVVTLRPVRGLALPGETVSLNASASQLYGTIVQWEWGFGTTVPSVSSSSSDTSFVLPALPLGTWYPCAARGTDDDGNVSQVSVCSIYVGLPDSVELNLYADDTADVWLNGDRVVFPKKRTSGREDQDTTATMVTLLPGANVLAVRAENYAWTGGFCASINLAAVGLADTIRTDGSWRCTEKGPVGDAWKLGGFTEVGWVPTGEYGPLAGPNGENPKPFFERSGYEPYNLWSQGALWLWNANPVYFRKSFQAAGQTAAAMIRGNGFSFRFYVNGVLLGEQLTVQDKSDPMLRYDNVALNNGENVVAIETECLDSVNFAFVKAAVQWGPTDRVFSDSTWKCSFSSSAGWNNTGFDDASWANAGRLSAYDGTTDALTPADWMWVSEIWFRKEFVVGH
jgi:hypothetical protein